MKLPSPEDRTPREHVVVIGAGFSGALLAINLLRDERIRVTLVERRRHAARGLAFSTPNPHHLLNVRAANMSAFPDAPDHFARWLAERNAGSPALFAPRGWYGRYLEELLDGARASAGGRFALVNGLAVDAEPLGGGWAVQLAGGGTLTADRVVLAIGNLPPSAPGPLRTADLPARRYAPDPWDPVALAGIDPDGTVLIVGTGLTMIDTVLALDASGFRGRCVALSRRGLVPHAHAAGSAAVPAIRERPAAVASMLVRHMRDRSDAIGWRAAIDELRPFTQMLWQAADGEARRRFLRHLRPWWDIHRHRMAPAVADRVAALRSSGRLELVAGSLVSVEAAEDGLRVRLRRRGRDAPEAMLVDRAINCTGPTSDLARSDDPLVASLLARGLIRSDPLRIGIDVTAQSEAIGRDGTASDKLLVVGPMTRGAFWEIVAVPDIRRQVWSVARTITRSHWVEGEGL